MSRSPWLLLLLALLTLGSVSCGIAPYTGGWKEPIPHRLKTGPYVLLGRSGQAFIALKGPSKPPEIRWWTSDEASAARVVAERDDDLWVATLDQLPNDQLIRYRVLVNGVAGDEHSFKTGPTQAGFRFAAFGDTRTGHDVHRAVVEGMVREDIDFVLHTGDMVDSGGVVPEWDLFFQIERPLLSDTPIIPAIGNHDKSSRGYFRHYFLNKRWAENRRYYVRDWGNLRMVSMDGGIECREGCQQFGYIAKALKEGADNGMLMVMMLHYPPYSSGHHGSHMGVRAAVSQLAARYGVEIVFAGHDHNYERTRKIDGVTYIVSGSAGAPIRPVRPQSFTAVARTEPHYVLVDVGAATLTVRAVNLGGDTFDTVVLSDNPPATARKK